MTTALTIGIASDHAGFACKEMVIAHLQSRGLKTEDYGTDSEASCDYPDYVHPLANALEAGKHLFGIAICGSANGVCMTVNKHTGIRGAIAWLPELAALARQHNDANILCIPARYLSEAEVKAIVDAFFDHDFEGGRHLRRVNKISL